MNEEEEKQKLSEMLKTLSINLLLAGYRTQGIIIGFACESLKNKEFEEATLEALVAVSIALKDKDPKYAHAFEAAVKETGFNPLQRN